MTIVFKNPDTLREVDNNLIQEVHSAYGTLGIRASDLPNINTHRQEFHLASFQNKYKMN